MISMISAALAAGLALSAAADEPDYYVEYIESTYPGAGGSDADSPWIDTGIKATPLTRLEMEFQVTFARASLQPSPFGAEFGTFWFALYYNGSSQWAIDFVHGGDSKGRYVGILAATDAEQSRYYINLDGQNKVCAITNLTTSAGAKVDMKDYSTQAADVTDYNLPLFGRVKNESQISAPGYRPKMKLYSCDIYENGELERQFRPAVKGGVAGLWDKKNGSFYASKTARAFIAGKKISGLVILIK